MVGLLITKLERFITESVSNFFSKSVNVWQSYKQERDCLVHFLCPISQAYKVHETTTFLLANLPNFNRFYLFTLTQQYTFLNLVSNNHTTL